MLAELQAAVERLAVIDGKQDGADHRNTHALADCNLCREWAAAVIDVALRADRVFWPMQPVRDAIAKMD